MLGYSPMMAPLSLGDRSRIALGQVVTSNHFTMLGVQPFLGRLLVPSDDDPASPRVVVISHRMWQREFGGDPAIVGKTLTLRGQAYTIAGVAPASFTGVVPLLTPELWLPIQHVEEVEPAGHQRFGAVAGRQDAARAPRLAMDVREGPAEARRHRGSRPTPTSR